MRKNMLLIVFLLGANIAAQKKKTTLSNWKNEDSKIAQDIFSKYGQKSKSSEELKKRLLQSQKILKIEITNEGDWEELNQIAWFRFVKINDGKLDQILHDNSNLELVNSSTKTNHWKDENGNMSFRSISEPLKISQEYTSTKNEKGQIKSFLSPTEIYETTAPVISFSFQVYTHRIDNNPTIKTDLSKTINIYANGKLIKTFKYSYAELKKVGGITLKNFEIGVVE